MTQHDRDNLKFLLNADKDTLRDWYASVKADDHEYAMEIMVEYSNELRQQSIEFQVEKLLEDSDWQESAQVISKFVGYMPGEKA